jgi:hypothetical protein
MLRVVDQGLQDVVNHRKLAIVVLELTLNVPQVIRQTIKPLGKEFQERICDFLVPLEKLTVGTRH